MNLSKKHISRTAACAVAAGLVFPYAAPCSPNTEYSLIQAVEASASDTFISKPVSNNGCTIFTDGSDSFNMNGRTYSQGIVMGDGSYVKGAEIVYDVENAESITFTLGHIDNSDTSSAEFSVYLDDILEDKFTLSGNNALEEYTINTSKASRLKITRKGAYSQYALADVKVNGTASSQKFSVPQYSTAAAFTGSCFNSVRTTVYDGTNTESFFLMNGRQYFQGIVLGNGDYQDGASVSFNVENVKQLSFSIGHVDNSTVTDTVFSIYLDNVLEDKITVTGNSLVSEYTLDVSGASTVRIVKSGTHSQYAIADISVDEKAPARTFASPVFKNAGSFIAGIYDNYRTTCYDGSTSALSFNMKGRTFYQGIVMGNGDYQEGSSLSLNVENISTLSFTLGHVDNSSLNSAEFSVWIDNKLEDKFTLSHDEPLREYTLDVSKARTVRIYRNGNYSQFGLGNIKADELTSKNTYSVPENKSSAALIDSAFDAYRTKSYDGITGSVSFNMAGRKYCQGIILGDGSYQEGSAFSLNVENTDTIRFDLGHLDNSDTSKSEFKITLDNEPYDTIELSYNMPVKTVTIDVSDVKVIRFSSSCSSYSRYALGDIITDTLTPKHPHEIPQYASDAKFAESAYDCIRSKKYYDDNKFTFFTMNGENYTQGLTIGENSYQEGGYATYNVENYGKISFTLGNIDGVDSEDAKLKIYIDNVLADTLDLSKDMVPTEYSYDVSSASTVHFGKTNSYGVYGIGNIKLSGNASAAPAPTASVKPSASAAPTTAASVKPSASAAPTTAASVKPSASAAPTTAVSVKPSAPASPVPTAPASGVPAAKPVKDINGDGKVTTSDVRTILQFLVGSVKLTDEQTAAADVNGDGTVNSNDAVVLLRRIAGLTN